MVPNMSLVTDNKYWKVTGALLALGLLAGESLHPVSPAVVYALLSSIHQDSDPINSMNWSLHFIWQLDDLKAKALIPWMIIPPGQDWKSLPVAHRAMLRDLTANLGLEVTQVTFFLMTADKEPLSAPSKVNQIHKRARGMDKGPCYRCNIRKPILFLLTTVLWYDAGLQQACSRSSWLVRGGFVL